VHEAHVLSTGVELTLAEEQHDDLPDPPELATLPMTPEARAEQARIAAGGMVDVRATPFVIFETGGETHRYGGGSQGRAIDVTTDPTIALLDLAEQAREEAPFGDLRRSGFDVTRFEYYSSPHSLVLSERLRERLTSAWKDRPPR
jgi:hypothetical protein